MKYLLTIVLFATGFFSASYVMGQIYNDKAESVVDALDQAIVAHQADYANVAFPGDLENQKPQDERYTNMVKPIDDANQRHFNNESTSRSKDR